MAQRSAVLLALFGAAAAQVSCQQFECPEGRTRTDDPAITCPDHVSGRCLTSRESGSNTDVCCPLEVRSETGLVGVEDDYTPLVCVNVVGAVPLGIVIALMVWSARSISKREEQEVAHLHAQASLFEDMENESMRRSFRSSMFVKSDRRRSMRVRSSLPLTMASARPMVLAIEKEMQQSMGFAVEDTANGLTVIEVAPDSPAEIAGVQRGMVLKKVHDRVVHQGNVQQAIAEAPNHFTIQVLVKEVKEGDGRASFSGTGSMYGSLRGVVSKLYRFRVVKPAAPDAVLGLTLTGLDITQLHPNGVAHRAGLRVGMTIYAVDGTRATANNIAKLVSNAPSTFLVDCTHEVPDYAETASVATYEGA